jgi:hypothetical protein
MIYHFEKNTRRPHNAKTDRSGPSPRTKATRHKTPEFVRLLQLVGLTAVCLGTLAIPSTHADLVVDLDALDVWTQTGPTGSYYNGNANGTTNNDGWTADGVHFGNRYDSAWGGFWSGFAYSNVNDPDTAGHGNQYAAITGTGWGGQGNYAIAYSGAAAFFDLPAGLRPSSIWVTNTTYAYLTMRDGDSFSKKFGGDSGQDPDWFRLTFSGYDQVGGQGNLLGSVDFYLADFRFDDSNLDYLINQWTAVDLTGLGAAASVRLTFAGSDMGAWGLNTPAYAALDQLTLTAVPEPHGLWLVGLATASLLFRRQSRQSPGAMPSW